MIHVELRDVALTREHKARHVGEALVIEVQPPEVLRAGDAPLRLQDAGEPHAAVMRREVKERVVVIRFQRLQKIDFGSELLLHAHLLPLLIDRVDVIEIRVPGQHLTRAVIHQSVDSRVRVLLPQKADERRGEEDVSKVAEFRNQYAFEFHSGAVRIDKKEGRRGRRDFWFLLCPQSPPILIDTGKSDGGYGTALLSSIDGHCPNNEG